MGCDIHCFVEYRDKSAASLPDTKENSWARSWRDFGDRINPGRNYSIFASMAGVRCNEPEPIVQPRGFPSDAGWAARSGNNLYIVDHDTDAEGHCSRDQAMRWVASGSSEYVGDEKPEPPAEGEITEFEGVVVATKNPTWVTHPDWHTHSWLTTDEYARAIRKVGKPSEEPEYYAILAAMRQFEAAGFDARLVFWFDN